MKKNVLSLNIPMFGLLLFVNISTIQSCYLLSNYQIESQNTSSGQHPRLGPADDMLHEKLLFNNPNIFGKTSDRCESRIHNRFQKSRKVQI